MNKKEIRALILKSGQKTTKNAATISRAARSYTERERTSAGMMKS